MNPKLKQMWDQVRTQKMASHRDFRPITLQDTAQNKVILKVDPDYTSKERKNVRPIQP